MIVLLLIIKNKVMPVKDNENIYSLDEYDYKNILLRVFK
jgi:hypothetical protein